MQRIPDSARQGLLGFKVGSGRHNRDEPLRLLCPRELAWRQEMQSSEHEAGQALPSEGRGGVPLTSSHNALWGFCL